MIIDSRYKTADSVSNADFYVQLPWNCTVPAGSQLFIDGIVLSHSWNTIISGQNDTLYMKEVVSGTTEWRKLILTAGDYNGATLATHLKALLNTGTTMAASSWNVVFAFGHLTISNSTPQANGVATIFSRAEVEATSFGASVWGGGAGAAYGGFPVHDCNELIGNMATQNDIYLNSPLVCSYIDLMIHKQLFLHAPGLGESSMMTLQGNTDCIRRIILGQSQTGDVITDVLQTAISSVTFGTDTTLQRIHFQIKGYDGRVIPMQFHQVSFEMIIIRPDDK
jgi:hypothetical protein